MHRTDWAAVVCLGDQTGHVTTRVKGSQEQCWASCSGVEGDPASFQTRVPEDGEVSTGVREVLCFKLMPSCHQQGPGRAARSPPLPELVSEEADV